MGVNPFDPVTVAAQLGTKGTKGGQCFRTVCKQAPAQWYNRSTRKYYCENCARVLNEVALETARRLYGGPLCIKE